MADPAPPILGSTLLAAALARSRSHPALPPLCTGYPSIDTALDGGLRFGEITSVAGASGMGKTLVGCVLAPSVLHLRILCYRYP